MKRAIIILLAMTVSMIVNSQDKYWDSLEYVVEHELDPLARYDNYIGLSKYHSGTYDPRGRRYARKALQIAQDLSSNEKIAESYLWLAMDYVVDKKKITKFKEDLSEDTNVITQATRYVRYSLRKQIQKKYKK